MMESDAMFHNSSIRKPKSVESTSSSAFDKLTDELLIETLIRLPVKPANLCKCISIRFRSLISSSYFVRCYINHNRINNSLALYYQSKPMNLPSLTPIDLAFDSPIFESPGFSLSFIGNSVEQKHETLQYLASNNGLILCCASFCRRIVYYVCNPLTKQSVALPPPPSNIESETVYIGFLCIPQYSCHDDDDDDDKYGKKTRFKVVRIEVVNCESPSLLSGTLKLEVFCSVMGKWTEEYFISGSGLDRDLFYGWNFMCRTAVVFDGLLHWDALSIFGIFTYDPCNGECRTIKFPLEIRKPVWWEFTHCFGEQSGLLRYANSDEDLNYLVWELTGTGTGTGGGEWRLLHKVHLDDMKATFESIDKCYLRLLSPHPLDQNIIFFWCQSSDRIVEYDMRNKVLTLPCFIRDAKIMCLLMFSPFVLPCWPTAVPLIKQHDLN